MSIETITEKPSLCFQCSKCSAGCPLAKEMDILPHQLIHMLSLGMEDEVLKSKTIWLCAGCFTCAVRCPNDINITSIMDKMRSKAFKAGIPCPEPEILTFHRNFIGDFARRGRVHEMRMMAEYNLRIMKPFQNAMLAPVMFLKGRLHLLPPRSIKGFKKWMNTLWN